ncbi:MAG: hypothetical protein RQ824_11420 [bacterium]|nr:hypothetical protein [bacterium]
MSKKRYDTVIYGGRLSGLLAAALLSDKGAKVLIINDEASSEKVEKGYKLDFQMLPIGNIPDSPAVTNILGRLGLGLSNKERFTPAELLFQVITGKHRIDFSWKEKTLEAELVAEFDGEASRIIKVLADRSALRGAITEGDHERDEIFPPYGLKARLGWKFKGRAHLFNMPEETLEQVLSGLDISDSLKKVISLPSKFSTSLYPVSESLPFVPFISCLEGYYPKGGMSGFKKLILAGLKDRGVEFKDGASVEKFLVQKNKINQLTLKGCGSKILAKSFIFNSDPVNLPALLPQKFFTKTFIEGLKVCGGRLWWQSIFIGIDADIIPVGMHDNLIVDDDEDLPFMIQMVPVSESGATPEGKRLMKISRAIDNSADIAASKNNLIRFEKSALRRLNDLIPFLDKGKFEVLYKSASKPFSSDDYLVGEPLLAPAMLGSLSPLTPYGNLFISGREIMPVFGIEGDFLSAEMIAHNLLKVIAEPEK